MKVNIKSRYYDKELRRTVTPNEVIDVTEARAKALVGAGVGEIATEQESKPARRDQAPRQSADDE